MRFRFLEGIVLFAVLFSEHVMGNQSNEEFNNIIIKGIFKKIEKIALSYSKAPSNEKPQILQNIKDKLKSAAKQSFGNEMEKYIDLIIQEVKLKASENNFNDSKNVTNYKTQNDSLRRSYDEFQSQERIVKDHMSEKLTDKIDKFAAKYLMNLNTFEEKRKFLENVREKILDVAKGSKQMNENEITNYSMMISNSINDILKRNHQNNRRKMMNDIKNSSNEWLEYSSSQITETLKYEVENPTLEKECIISIATICSEVKSINKFQCNDDKIISIENICNGIVDCSDGSDEHHCIHKVIQRLTHVKKVFLEIIPAVEQNCLYGENNKSLRGQNIIRDSIKAQVDVINDYQDSFSEINTTESNEDSMKKITNVVNAVILNLNKGICSKHENTSRFVANTRRFISILEKDLEDILKESAFYPKSCICEEDRCVSQTCIKTCQNACLLKYRLGRFSCPSVNGTSSVDLDVICDGKLDCYDESDETECSTGKGRGKFEANEAFRQITRNLEMKMASKENRYIREDLLRLYNLVIKLQHLTTTPKPRSKEIKTIRDKCFQLLSLIYGNFMRTSYNKYETEDLYRSLYSVNKFLVSALKYTDTGNPKIVSSSGCICRNNKCAMRKCSIRCLKVCSVENKLRTYYCKDSPRNLTVSLDAICNGKNNCPNGDDEVKCNEICRRHHLYFLRMNIQDVGRKQESTTLGELLKFWKTKATSMLLIAEKNERPTPFTMKQIVKEMLQDLIYTYASFDTSKKKKPESVLQDFLDISKIVVNGLRNCGK